jgi:hypothetical protein
MEQVTGSALLAGNSGDAASAPNATTQAPAVAPANTSVTPSSPFWDAFKDPELKESIGKRGFSDVETLAKSYRELEKAYSSGEKMPLPKGNDDLEGWNKVYDRLGRPKTPEEYGIQSEDKEFGEFTAKTFHEVGLNANQAKAIADKHAEFVAKRAELAAEERAKASIADMESLKKDWGAAHDQNMEIARRAAKEFGITPELADKIGDAAGISAFAKLLHSIGAKLSESPFVQGDVKYALTPAAAKERIAALRSDTEFVNKYMSGNVEARTELDNLHKMAYPE